MRYSLLLVLMLLPGRAFSQTVAGTPLMCEGLAKLVIPNTTITLAQPVAAGAFLPPTPVGAGAGRGRGQMIPGVPGRVTAAAAGLGLGYNGGRGVPPFSTLPAFCRIAAMLKPSPSSDIHMEAWLPVTGWNGHFRGTSPNGLGGNINYTAMSVGLTDGFAVVSMDTGHQGASQGNDIAWMLNPEKITDFAGRAMHEATVAGKALTTAYYGNSAKYSYMIECGGGTNAAMHELQKYPTDYNGIVVGGFAAHWSRQIFAQMWPWLATR